VFILFSDPLFTLVTVLRQIIASVVKIVDSCLEQV